MPSDLLRLHRDNEGFRIALRREVLAGRLTGEDVRLLFAAAEWRYRRQSEAVQPRPEAVAALRALCARLRLDVPWGLRPGT